jgi:acyl-CoA thioester hydrolase
MSQPTIPFRTTIPVRYHETDQMGVVHHAVYIHYFEVGRTEMMRTHGLDYAEMERRGILLAVIDVGLRYLAPARFGDCPVIETRLTNVEKVRVRFDYRILRGEGSSDILCEGHTTLACVNPELIPVRIPADDRSKMLELVSEAV